MLVGDAASQVHIQKGSMLILLTPGRMDSRQARALLRDAKSVVLLLPSFDEDGRVASWQDSLSGMTSGHVQERTLAGVGLEVDWAWETVIEECNALYSAKPNCI